MRYFKSTDACKLAGMSRSALKMAIARRLMIVPAIKARGQGCRDLYSESQVFGLRAMRDMRARGVDARSSIRAFHFLSAFEADELLKRFAEGRKYLVVMDNEFIPRLVGIGAINDNPDFSLAKAARFGIAVVVVDVEAIWHSFRGSLQDHDAEAQLAVATEEQKEPA